MNLNLRWQLLLVLSGLLLVAVLLTYRVSQPVPVSGPEALPPDLVADLPFDPLCSQATILPGGTIVTGVVGRPRALNPLLADENPVDRLLSQMIFSGLTRLDDKGQVIPQLAEEWTISEDRLSVIFKLREDVQWQDGIPVTAEDVLFTVNLLQDEAVNRQLDDGPLWASLQAEKIDERQIRFTLPAPYAPFLEAAGRGLLPAHLLSGVSAVELMDHSFNLQPVGSGPFAVQNRWDEDGFLLLQPVRGSWPTPPLLDGLQIRFFADSGALESAFRQGEIDAAPLTADIVPDVLAHPGTRVFAGYGQQYAQVIFNLSGSAPNSAAVSDLAVRQALASALDKVSLIDEVMNGQALAFEGPYLPHSWAFDPALPRTYPYNREAAVAALENSGWLLPQGEPAGAARQKAAGETATTLALRLLVPDGPPARQIARHLADQWAPIGVALDIAAFDRETYVSRLAGREFDLALIEVTVPEDPDLYDFWSQEAIIRGQNFAGWNHRRASEALEAGRQVWSQEERRQFYRAFLTFYDQELPAVTLFQYVENFGVNDTIQGVNIGPLTQNRSRFRSFHRWYLRPETVEEDCSQD